MINDTRATGAGAQASDNGLRFGKWRGRWLDQVHDDPEMNGDTCRVMYAVTRFLNTTARNCKPGNMVLSTTAHVSVRTVQRAIAKAQKRGHLQVIEAQAQKPRILIPTLRGCESEGVTEGVTGFSGSACGIKHVHANSQNSQDSLPTSSASVAKRPRQPHPLFQDDYELVLNALLDVGRPMTIGGIVEFSREHGKIIDGATIGRMVKAGALRRCDEDSQYVWIPE